MLQISAKHIKVFAVIWLLFISVLFFLPGSALPKADWLNKVYFDKWVHAGFFALLIYSWRFYFPADVKYNGWILLFAFCYGMGVEVIQHYFVANRSFDLGDIAADMAGAVIGLWGWHRGYIKNRPL